MPLIKATLPWRCFFCVAGNMALKAKAEALDWGILPAILEGWAKTPPTLVVVILLGSETPEMLDLKDHN